MRTITLKYAGDCRECGATLEVGAQAVHERRVGIFCPEHEPTDTETIRAYRQEGADRKADKLDEWAKKREDKAAAVRKANLPFTSDIAFNTQPGHLPIRARIIKQEDKQRESLNKARGFREKASSLRHVQVKGDRERKRQAQRDAIRPLLKKGMLVDTFIYGLGTVARINKKTATIENTGTTGTFKTKVDLSFLRIIQTELS